MGLTSTNKSLSVSRIECGNSFQITLALTAAPEIITNPTDIVLILDRSGSMAGSPLANLKNGAKKFIDIIAESTGGTQDGQIGYGSRIGIVSFADTATQDTQLVTSVSALKTAVNNLSAGGRTNHADAFTKATQLFDAASSNAKVMIMFTDGVTTTGSDPNIIAAEAKAAGITIYCIGLSGRDGIDEQTLNNWASSPSSAYVSITPDDEELENLFENLARNISKPGATGIVIDEKVTPCFKITSMERPTLGNAVFIDNTSLQWRIDKLGVTGSEGASLTFTVQHVGSCSGTIDVNESITYRDNEQNSANFPSPKIEVECDDVVFPEECPTPVSLTVNGCDDTVEFDAGTLALESLGRIVMLDVTLKNVCPNKRVALAVILTEETPNNTEIKRGMKILTIPAHTQTCRDVTVRCIKFVLPDEPETAGSMGSCRERVTLKARMIAHYIDNDFECCNSAT